MLTNGNIKQKSKILKYHIFDELSDDALLRTEYSQYYASIKNIPGAESYLAIQPYLHDARIDNLFGDADVRLELTLQEREDNRPEHHHKIMIFKNGSIVSYNKVLRSGKIAALHKSCYPRTYLYDEVYSWYGRCFLTFIMTTKNTVASGVYYPLVTISFSSIEILGL
jgi:hypothetical protein